MSFSCLDPLHIVGAGRNVEPLAPQHLLDDAIAEQHPVCGAGRHVLGLGHRHRGGLLVVHRVRGQFHDLYPRLGVRRHSDVVGTTRRFNDWNEEFFGVSFSLTLKLASFDLNHLTWYLEVLSIIVLINILNKIQIRHCAHFSLTMSQLSFASYRSNSLNVTASPLKHFNCPGMAQVDHLIASPGGVRWLGSESTGVSGRSGPIGEDLPWSEGPGLSGQI